MALVVKALGARSGLLTTLGKSHIWKRFDFMSNTCDCEACLVALMGPGG